MQDSALPMPNASEWTTWTRCIQTTRDRLLLQDDLLTQLARRM
jgi:hypothetical protein